MAFRSLLSSSISGLTLFSFPLLVGWSDPTGEFPLPNPEGYEEIEGLGRRRSDLLLLLPPQGPSTRTGVGRDPHHGVEGLVERGRGRTPEHHLQGVSFPSTTLSSP